ncbi:MAG: hypothetical protein ACYC3I_04580 [Gemmataceae bacterium]
MLSLHPQDTPIGRRVRFSDGEPIAALLENKSSSDPAEPRP